MGMESVKVEHSDTYGRVVLPSAHSGVAAFVEIYIILRTSISSTWYVCVTRYTLWWCSILRLAECAIVNLQDGYVV